MLPVAQGADTLGCFDSLALDQDFACGLGQRAKRLKFDWCRRSKNGALRAYPQA
jgi:hypothetical protein